MPAPKATDELDRRAFATRATWRKWLAANHARRRGIWLRFFRKASGKPSVRYEEAVEEALCFGWIDSLVKSLDSDSYVQLFTPRKPRSVWSRPNKERVARMIESGLMTPAGLEKITIARENGSWNTLDFVDALEVPPDLARALAANRVAKRNFEAFSATKKKQILYRIAGAKRPETRRKRIELAVQLAAENRTV